MNSKTIMIIDPSLKTPEIESYNKLALKSPVKTSYHLPVIHNTKSMIESMNNIYGIILLGSAASVHGDFDWMKDIELVLQKAIKNKIPILGICFGHQFIGKIFGGKVDFLWGSKKKVGIRKVKINSNSLLQDSWEDYLIYSHNEGVVSCPKNFSIFGSSEMVEIEAMSHNYLPIWSFQSHIEASKNFAERIGVNQKNFEKIIPLSDRLIDAFFRKISGC